MEHQSEDPDQQDTQEKSRYGDTEDIDDIEELFRDRVLSPRRKDTQRNADQDDQGKGHCTQDQGHGEFSLQESGHGFSVHDGFAEITVHGSCDPVRILLDQGAVQPEFFAQIIQLLLGGTGSQHHGRGIARYNMKKPECHDRNDKKRQQHNAEFFDEIPHGYLL